MKPNCLIALLLTSAAALAQSSDTRAIVPESVVLARPKPSAAPVQKPPVRPQYAPVDASVTQSLRKAAADSRQVGVTIWKLRPGAPSDLAGTGARILVQEDSTSTEWVPERLGVEAVLREGDRVRLTVESPDSGFLYVIDRERYANGLRGDPYLIFPTTRTRDGDNRVTGGKLIDIPDQGDRPNFFTLRNSRADQSGEELTILLTKEPLEGVQIGAKPIALSKEQVATWEKRWGSGSVQRFELSGGAGKPWTKAEQEAASATRLLAQDDPPPQTVYRVVAKESDPVLLKVQLRYSSKGR
jgi:hypothetical protein